MCVFHKRIASYVPKIVAVIADINASAFFFFFVYLISKGNITRTLELYQFETSKAVHAAGMKNVKAIKWTSWQIFWWIFKTQTTSLQLWICTIRCKRNSRQTWTEHIVFPAHIQKDIRSICSSGYNKSQNRTRRKTFTGQQRLNLRDSFHMRIREPRTFFKTI